MSIKNITEQLMGLNKEVLVRLVENMRITGDTSYLYDIAPEGFSHESTFKDAKYSGMIDCDMEMSLVDTPLANIVINGWDITLDGDKVSLIPGYKKLDLKLKKKWTIKGAIKTEIVMMMIDAYKSINLGTYEGWTRYLIEYKEHTLVASINDLSMVCGLKLLQHDRLAREIYQKTYNQSDVEWRTVQLHDEVYGDMEVGIPHEYDNTVERMEVAVEFLESLMMQDGDMNIYIANRLRYL